ncbi:hypothetical protein EBZ39_19325 [bacterium]|nr:hypothetical protein [bacterium]
MHFLQHLPLISILLLETELYEIIYLFYHLLYWMMRIVFLLYYLYQLRLVLGGYQYLMSHLHLYVIYVVGMLYQDQIN